MEKSLFFNAFPDSSYETGYDRNYSADDISDWLSVVVSTGVIKDGLKVSAGAGLSVVVDTGKATIKGKGYVNDSALTLSTYEDGASITAPTGSEPRYDYVVLRLNNAQTQDARFTKAYVVKGTTAVPTFNQLRRDGEIYELMLAYFEVSPNSASISSVTDTRGDNDLCPWLTAVTGYDGYYDAAVQQYKSEKTLESTSAIITTDIPARLYLGKYSIVDVYTNGMKEEASAYSVSTGSGYFTITFKEAKASGAKVSVILSNFIDGAGLSTAINSYNAWVQDVADLKTANRNIYVCNGKTDNVEISNIVNNYRASHDDDSSIEIKVVGNFGYTAMAGGDGSSLSPYRLFNFDSGDPRAVLDFSDCSEIYVSASGAYAVGFYGSNISIRGLALSMYGASSGTSLKAFADADNNILCEDCHFFISGYVNCYIASGGTFEICKGTTLTSAGDSYCFNTGGSSILRLVGGEYLAYTGSNSLKSAVVGQSVWEAVSILYGVSAPTRGRANFYQKNAIYQIAGWVNCSDLVSALPIVASSNSNISGTIALSK